MLHGLRVRLEVDRAADVEEDAAARLRVHPRGSRLSAPHHVASTVRHLHDGVAWMGCPLPVSLPELLAERLAETERS